MDDRDREDGLTVPSFPRPESYRRALSRVASSIDLPFGYTLSIWSAGQLIIGRFGTPAAREIFLFAAGAISSYLLIALIALPRFSGEGVARMPGVALLNAMALVAAVAVSIVAAFAGSPPVGFFLGGFTATSVYALLLTLLVYVGERVGARGRPPER